MRILVTGGTGFLGRNIQDSLWDHFSDHSNHHEVYIGSKAFDLRYAADCCDAILAHKPDVIVHAAGSVGGIGANKENPGKFMYDNLMMGANVLEQARRIGVPKVVMLGTVCAYPKHTQVPFKEEDLWSGYPEETNAPYGVAKKALMLLGETYVEQYGMDVVNLIPVNMYGMHDHFNLTSSHVIPALILKFNNAIKNGDKEVTLWGSGSASREFLYAPDCVEAIALAIQNSPGPSPINIGTGHEITIRALADEISYQMGFEGELVWDTSKPDGQPRRCLDTSKAKETLGFEAPTHFQEGLKETIEYFLQHNKGTVHDD